MILVSAGWAGCAPLLLVKASEGLCVRVLWVHEGERSSRQQHHKDFCHLRPAEMPASKDCHPVCPSLPLLPSDKGMRDKNVLWLPLLSCGHTATHQGCSGFHGPREHWWRHCWSHEGAGVHVDYTKAEASIILPAQGTFFGNICGRGILLLPKTDAISFQ